MEITNEEKLLKYINNRKYRIKQSYLVCKMLSRGFPENRSLF